MCLTIKENARKRRLKKDRTVYKIVEEIRKTNFTSPYKRVLVPLSLHYVTPFQRMNVEMGESYSIDHKRIKFDWWDNTVSLGFHSMKTIEGANHIIKLLGVKGYKIVKCTIPANSFYVKGIFHDFESFASDSIQYDKIID